MEKTFEDNVNLLMNFFDSIETKIFSSDEFSLVRQLVFRFENSSWENLEKISRKKHFFHFLDRLNSSKRIREFLSKEFEHYGAFFVLCLRILIRLDIKLNENQIEIYRENLLEPMINRIDGENHRSILNDEILRFIEHLTGQTRTIPFFLRLDLPKILLRILFEQNSSTILKIIYRIVQHDNGRDVFIELKLMENLCRFVDEILKKKLEFFFDVELYRRTIEEIFLISIVSAENYENLSESTKKIHR